MASVAMLLLVLIRDYSIFCILVAISGAAQAPLWPACIKSLANHADDQVLGTFVGLLGTAPYAGASFSSALVSYISDRVGWRHSMTPILIICMVWSVFVGIFLKSGSYDGTSKKEPPIGVRKEQKMLDILQIDGLIQVTWAVFFLKFVRYALYMWLPMYLNQGLKYSMINAGLVSTIFHFGAAFGGPIVGYLVDKSSNR